MQETANKQKRITLKNLHEMLDGMSVELAGMPEGQVSGISLSNSFEEEG